MSVDPLTASKFADKVNAQLEELDTDTSSGGAMFKIPFEAARICQGVGLRLGIPADDTMRLSVDVLNRFAEFNEIDPDDFLESVFEKWASVKHPKGAHDPVQEAYESAKREGAKTLPGFWPTKKLKYDCSKVYALAVRLSNYGQNEFYLPCRKLAEVIGCDRTRAASILNTLCERGHLEKVGTANEHRAQRFLLETLTEKREQIEQRIEGTQRTDRTHGTEEHTESVEYPGRHVFSAAEFASIIKGIDHEQ